jgi:phage gpG-like protein
MSKFKFDKVLQNMKEMKATLPAVLGATGTRFFTGSFRNQGFTDSSLTLWEQRKQSRRDNGRAILVKSGTLRKAVNNSLQGATWDLVKWNVPASEVPYASIHNNGGTVMRKARVGVVRMGLTKNFERTNRFVKAGKLHIRKDVIIGAHASDIPQRQYMGDSVKLREIFRNKIDIGMKRCFRTK